LSERLWCCCETISSHIAIAHHRLRSEPALHDLRGQLLGRLCTVHAHQQAVLSGRCIRPSVHSETRRMAEGDKVMKKLLISSIFTLLLVGCATTENYEKLLNTWIGDSADNLVSSWGPPTSSYPLSNGGKVMEYVRARTVQTGGYSYSVPQTTYQSGSTSIYGSGGGYAYGTYSGTSTTNVQKMVPVTTLNYWCKTRFTVDNNNRITTWRWEGNNCRARAPK